MGETNSSTEPASCDPKYGEEWFCTFCLTVVQSKEAPLICQACHVSRCANCNTFVKGDDPKWCHGCGEIGKAMTGHFVKTCKTGAFYAEENWRKRNLGAWSDGEYSIACGVGSVQLMKTDKEGKYQVLRDLSSVERKYLGYKDDAAG